MISKVHLQGFKSPALGRGDVFFSPLGMSLFAAVYAIHRQAMAQIIFKNRKRESCFLKSSIRYCNQVFREIIAMCMLHLLWEGNQATEEGDRRGRGTPVLFLN